MALREQVIMPRLVNFDYSTDAANKGDTITVPIPVSQVATEVAPSITPPAEQTHTPTTVSIALDQWYESRFHLTDKELTEIDRNEHFVPMQLSEAVRALANRINEHIWGFYVGVYGFVGTEGVTPFTGGVDDAVQVRKELNIQLCPKSNRRCVMDYVAEAEALKQAPFRDASASTDRQVIIEGEIGRKYGLDWFADDHVPTHTAVGTGTILVNDASVSIGDTTLTFDGGGTNPVAGDVFTVNGDTQTYACQSVTGQVISIQPAAKVAWADDAALTFKTTHVVNLAFHRDAFAFATRPLASTMADLELGHRIASLQDPQSGVVLRLEVSRQYKQTSWSIDVLWGAQLVRPDLAVRLVG